MASRPTGNNRNNHRPQGGGQRSGGGRPSSAPGGGSRGNSGYDDDGSRNVLITVITVGVALFLSLCNFGLCGGVGDKISSVFFGAFGFESYITPAFIGGMIVWGLYKGERDYLLPVRMSGSIGLFLILGIFSDLCGSVQDRSELRLVIVFRQREPIRKIAALAGSAAQQRVCAADLRLNRGK